VSMLACRSSSRSSSSKCSFLYWAPLIVGRSRTQASSSTAAWASCRLASTATLVAPESAMAYCRSRSSTGLRAGSARTAAKPSA